MMRHTAMSRDFPIIPSNMASKVDLFLAQFEHYPSSKPQLVEAAPGMCTSPHSCGPHSKLRDALTEALAPIWLAMDLNDQRFEKLEMELALLRGALAHLVPTAEGKTSGPGHSPLTCQSAMDVCEIDAKPEELRNAQSGDNIRQAPPALQSTRFETPESTINMTDEVGRHGGQASLSDSSMSAGPHPESSILTPSPVLPAQASGQFPQESISISEADIGRWREQTVPNVEVQESKPPGHGCVHLAKALLMLQETTKVLTGVVWGLQDKSDQVVEELTIESNLRQEGQARQVAVATGLQVQLDDTISAIHHIRLDNETMVAAALRQMCAFSAQLLQWSADEARSMHAARQDICQLSDLLGSLQLQVDANELMSSDGLQALHGLVDRIASQVQYLQDHPVVVPLFTEEWCSTMSRLETFESHLLLVEEAVRQQSQLQQTVEKLQELQTKVQEDVTQKESAMAALVQTLTNADLKWHDTFANSQRQMEDLQRDLSAVVTKLNAATASKVEVEALQQVAAESQCKADLASLKLQAYTSEACALQAQMAAQVSRIDTLQSALEKVSANMQASEAENAKLRADFSQERKQLGNFHDMTTRCCEDLAQLRSDMAEFSGSVMERSANFRALQEQVAHLSSAVLQDGSAHDALQVSLAARSEWCAGLESEVASYKKELLTLQSTVSELQQQNACQKADCNGLKAQVSSVTSSLGDVQVSVEATKAWQEQWAQQRQRQQSYTDGRLREHDTALSDLQTTVSGLSHAETEHRAQMAALKRCIRDNVTSMDELSASQEASKAAHHQLSEDQRYRCHRLEEELQRCVNAVARMRDELEEERCHKSEQRQKPLGTSSEALESAMEELRASMDAMQNRWNAEQMHRQLDTDGQLAVLESLVASLREDVAAVHSAGQEQLGQVWEEVRQSIEAMHDLMGAQFQGFQQQVQDHSQQQAALAQSFCEWDRALGVLRNDVVQLATNCQAQWTEVASLRRDAETTSGLLRQLGTAQAETHSACMHNNQRQQQLEGQLGQCETAMANLMESLDNVKSSNQQHDRAIAAAQADIKKLLASVAEKTLSEDVKEQLQQFLNSEAIKLQKGMEALLHRDNQFEQQLAELRNQNGIASQALEEVQKSIAGQLHTALEKLKWLEDRTLSGDHQSSLKRQIQDMQTKGDKASESLQRRMTTCEASLATHVAEVLRQKQQGQDMKAEHMLQWELINKRVMGCEEALQVLQDGLAQLRLSMQRRAEEVQGLSKRMDQREAHLRGLSSQVEVMEKVMEEMKSDHQEDQQVVNAQLAGFDAALSSLCKGLHQAEEEQRHFESSLRAEVAELGIALKEATASYRAELIAMQVKLTETGVPRRDETAAVEAASLLRNELAELTRGANALAKDFLGLRSDVGHGQAAVAQLEVRHRESNAKLQRLQQEQTNLQERCGRCEGSMMGLRAAHEEQAAESRYALANLTNQVEMAEANIAQLQQQLVDFQHEKASSEQLQVALTTLQQDFKDAQDITAHQTSFASALQQQVTDIRTALTATADVMREEVRQVCAAQQTSSNALAEIRVEVSDLRSLEEAMTKDLLNLRHNFAHATTATDALEAAQKEAAAVQHRSTQQQQEAHSHLQAKVDRCEGHLAALQSTVTELSQSTRRHAETMQKLGKSQDSAAQVEKTRQDLASVERRLIVMDRSLKELKVNKDGGNQPSGQQLALLQRVQEVTNADIADLKSQLSELGGLVRDLQHKHAEWEDPARRIFSKSMRKLEDQQTALSEKMDVVASAQGKLQRNLEAAIGDQVILTNLTERITMLEEKLPNTESFEESAN